MLLSGCASAPSGVAARASAPLVPSSGVGVQGVRLASGASFSGRGLGGGASTRRGRAGHRSAAEAASSNPKGRQPWDVGRFLQTLVFFNNPFAREATAGASASSPLLDAARGVRPSFGPLDDVVMGGVSLSGFRYEDGAGEKRGTPAGVFSGTVRVENNGGFASVRSKDVAWDLSGAKGIRIRVKSEDGNRYKLILRDDANWDGISWCKSFDTAPGKWTTVSVPFKDFEPVFRARTLKGSQLKAPFDQTNIRAVQLMVSKFEYDGALNPRFYPGEFRLAVDTIVPF